MLHDENHCFNKEVLERQYSERRAQTASGPAHVVSHSTLLYVVYVWFYPIASTRT